MDPSIRRLTPREEARALQEQLRETGLFKGNPPTLDVHALAVKAKTIKLKKEQK